MSDRERWQKTQADRSSQEREFWLGHSLVGNKNPARHFTEFVPKDETLGLFISPWQKGAAEMNDKDSQPFLKD